MGSDDSVPKRLHHHRTQTLARCLLRFKKLTQRPQRILIGIITFVLLLLLTFIVSPSSLSSSPTNRVLITPSELTAAQNDLPPQCHAPLHTFATHLHQPSSFHKIIFCCHRKWCASYGHCEPCRGIGDRTRHVLSMITDAMALGVGFQLDYPQEGNGVELRFPSLIYQDKWGTVGEWMHVRGYDVSDGVVDVSQWGKDVTEEEETFVHFIPHHYKLHAYDPCLYHILFRTTKELRTEIEYYAHLFQMDSHPVLGIHFRTGDLTAFGVHNADVRSSHDSLQTHYHKMLSCASAHAAALGIPPGDKLHFYLATDNAHVKSMAQQESRYVIHMVEEEPSAYLSAQGDRLAFLELYLLSRTRGLVMNSLPASYQGPAEVLSTFGILAFQIGFMKEEQLKACPLE